LRTRSGPDQKDGGQNRSRRQSPRAFVLPAHSKPSLSISSYQAYRPAASNCAGRPDSPSRIIVSTVVAEAARYVVPIPARRAKGGARHGDERSIRPDVAGALCGRSRLSAPAAFN
jgi:hypothetical protein